MKYKTVSVRESKYISKYAVKYKKYWFMPWKFIKRHGEKNLIMTWDTLPGANAYIKREKEKN